MMTARKFCVPLRAIAKCFSVMLVGAIVLLCAFPTAALAHPSGDLFAIAASSRFAAESEMGEPESFISESRLKEMQEKRRQWQSEASADAAAEAEDETASSLGEAFREKLNLDEIKEENEIVDDITGG